MFDVYYVQCKVELQSKLRCNQCHTYILGKSSTTKLSDLL